jgi:hypothetical protein
LWRLHNDVGRFEIAYAGVALSTVLERCVVQAPGVALSHTKWVPSVARHYVLLPDAGQHITQALDVAHAGQINSVFDVHVALFLLSSAFVSQFYQDFLGYRESSIQITMNSSLSKRSSLGSSHQ